MKTSAILFSLLFYCSLFAQEKGVSPISTYDANPGATYAVVIGISDYQNESIPDLRFADKDAEAFASFLRSPAGGNLDDDHLILLTNESATAGKVISALYWLVDESREGDQAIIYFSGHGDVEGKFRGQPGFLLCWDSPAQVYMAGGVLQLGNLQTVISTLSLDIKAKVTVITDACRSGKLAGSENNGSQLTNANLSQQFANEIKILSCHPDEYSIEGEQWGGGRGAFSYHLIDGLYGMADNNDDLSVNLMEISRYLEDNVTAEVAPQSQIPMVIGSRSEKLTKVFPEILEQLKQKKQEHLTLFTASESKGMEDEILAQADTSVRKMYRMFKQALKNKIFLEPTDACADTYYNQLMQESSISRLHAAMTRNYAASLQDDAQQVMNKWLEADSRELGASETKQTLKYQLYPRYLRRASALLGEQHYMFTLLQARKLFFEGYLMHIDHRHTDRELGEKILAKYRESLKWQPHSPHVYYTMAMVYFTQMQEIDSAEYYAHRAVEAAPSWIMPYSNMAFLYNGTFNSKYSDQAKYFLELADQIDSTAAEFNAWHMTNWSSYYILSSQFSEAEKLLKKIQNVDTTYVNAYVNLGNVYIYTSRWADAEAQYKKAIAIDSNSWLAQCNLGMVYDMNNRYEEAEIQYKKTIALDSTNLVPLIGMTKVYIGTGRYEEAEREFEKIMRWDSSHYVAAYEVGSAYRKAGFYREAEIKYQKAIQIDSNYIYAVSGLGYSYIESGRYEEAEKQFLKAVKIDSAWIGGNPLIGLGQVYKKTLRYALAEAQFKKVIQLDPASTRAYNELGDCLLKTNRYEEAEQQFRKVLQIDSLNAMAYGYLGLLYARTGQYVKAASSLQRSLSLDSNNDKYPLMNFALLYSLQNKLDKAFDYLGQALEKGYKYSDTHVDLKEEPGFVVLREQKERWDALMEQYFPDIEKE